MSITACLGKQTRLSVLRMVPVASPDAGERQRRRAKSKPEYFAWHDSIPCAKESSVQKLRRLRDVDRSISSLPHDHVAVNEVALGSLSEESAGPW